MTLLKAQDIRAYYRDRLGREVRAVESVSLELREGEVLGIAGESGCGKSTLARALANLFYPPLYRAGGSVMLGEDDLYAMGETAVRRQVLGKRISYIPQSAMAALNPTRRVRKFVTDVMSTHYPDMRASEMLARARERLQALSLGERVLESYPFELSGGMQQRTVVAISSLMNPDVVIADEPTSALDVSTQKALVRMLRDLLDRGFARSLIFITHDLTVLRHICDRIAVMYAGEFVEVGTAEQVIFDPAHPYSRALVESVLVPERGMRERPLRAIPGAPPPPGDLPQGCRFGPRCAEHNADCRAVHGDLADLKGRLVRCPRLEGLAHA
jgi:peptide/nickel transport system ATP-binding protein